MATLTIPLSRIEGHARVVIAISNSQAVSAHFQATELRGFDRFVQGTPPEQVPIIASRICGVCSTAHHLAAIKAIESIYGVTVPIRAVRIRELMMLGQVIQNQATSLFMFTMPDLPGQAGVPSLFHLDEVHSKIAPRALAVRRVGTALITLAGGQCIHPVRAVIGGVLGGIPRAAAEEMRAQLAQALTRAQFLLDAYWALFEGLEDRIGTLGDDSPTYYMAAIEHGHAFYGEQLRLMAPDGTAVEPFAACDYAQYLTDVPIEGSYSDGTLYRGELLRANSLARINLDPHPSTPMACAYTDRFWAEWGYPAHAILLFDLARGIELVYALERARELLDEDLETGELRTAYTPRDGGGCGLVEAPRGPLIHHYRVERDLIHEARFVIPTQHNILAIERALLVAARRYISPKGIDLELERAVGRVVRAFDPCIACATH